MALTALKVKNAKPGRHVDGRGLCLLVKESGAATWVLRMQHKGRRRDYGLGSAMDVSLVEAREAATVLRSKVRAGADPVAERRKARKVIPSFETAARDCYDALKEGWKNRRYANWISSFENHVFPHIVSVRARGVIFGGDLGAAGGGACPTTSSFDLGGHRAHR